MSKSAADWWHGGPRVIKFMLTAALGALALAGCGNAGPSNQIQIVGSSTVYPFTTAVAERFVQMHPRFVSPIVESTGTGAGLKLFCNGVGNSYPDMANASRRIKAGELDSCRNNGVNRVIEVAVGIDGLVLIEARNGPAMNLTLADVYRALAANPFGRPQTARTWRDVNPALLPIPIQLYGPPPTSGTRDSFAELVLEKGCDSDPAMKALKERDADQHKQICTKIREDGPFIEAGENDNLLVQKVSGNPGALGVLGFSFLEENLDRVKAVTINGVQPTVETISNLTYPGARQIYVYAKGEHIGVVPGMTEFLAEYARAWSPGGYLALRGLIPSPPQVRAQALQAATALTPLDPAALK
jgi:phosphate transport system substrate-binding protein